MRHRERQVRRSRVVSVDDMDMDGGRRDVLLVRVGGGLSVPETLPSSTFDLTYPTKQSLQQGSHTQAHTYMNIRPSRFVSLHPSLPPSPAEAMSALELVGPMDLAGVSAHHALELGPHSCHLHHMEVCAQEAHP